MGLNTIKLIHLRGYQTVTMTPIDEVMTGIVGRNDYGKSTISKSWPFSLRLRVSRLTRAI